MGCTGLQGTIRVCNGAASVVVKVTFNVTLDHSTESPDQVIDFAWSRHANGIRDTNPRYSDLIDSAVDAEQVNKIAPEAILGAKSDLLPCLGLTLQWTYDYVDPIHACLHCQSSVIHITSYMR
ncbi:MAG: hypothetical protein Q9198_010894 [Flavoplaca austrocitrina]